MYTHTTSAFSPAHSIVFDVQKTVHIRLFWTLGSVLH